MLPAPAKQLKGLTGIQKRSPSSSDICSTWDWRLQSTARASRPKLRANPSQLLLGITITRQTDWDFTVCASHTQQVNTTFCDTSRCALLA